TRQNSAMDVVLSIDMSGSMGSWNGGKKKIDAARDAAKSLIDILYGDEETNEHLKVGLVPWNGNVNVFLDTSNASPRAGYIPSKTEKKYVSSFKNPNTGDWQDFVWKITNSPVLLVDEPGPNWKGCVYARYLNDGSTLNDADDDLGYVDDYGWKGWEPRIKLVTTTTYSGKKKKKKKTETVETTCNNCTPCLNHGITPLNQSKTRITNAINKLKNPEGNTDIPQGLSWAWRVLMNTAPFTEGTADDPNKPLVRAVVLLTDGANCAADGDGYKEIWGGCGWYSTQKMDERAIAIAAKMKAQGILIYTIQFGFNDSDAASTLKKIASGTGSPYYQYAPNASTLKAVFETIGTSLSDLRISK
ncbi:MAG: VWA domain-containing protein, partial [Bauldia litoralis]